MKKIGVMFGLLVFGVTGVQAEGVLGVWQTPTGGAVEVYRCGDAVCAKVLRLSRNEKDTTDVMNPIAALQKRPLCGLEIGQGFSLTDANHAENGSLYDPNVGKTYTGSMLSEGNQLKLRGYVGLKVFGRTETWVRIPDGLAVCKG